MNFFSVELLAGERLIKIIRKNPFDFLAYSFRLLVVGVVVLSFYFFYPDFDFKKWIFGVAILFLVLFFIKDFLVWYLESLVITDKRLIDVSQKSLTDRIVTEVSLKDVEKVLAIPGRGIKRVLAIGCLVVQVKEGGKIAILNISRPLEIVSGINQLKFDLEKENQKSGI
jgi:hypothetical protein